MTSIEKREIIIQAKAEGLKTEEIARVYHVGRSAVYALLAVVEETGDIQPLPLLLFLIFQDGLLHVVILDN